MRFSYGVAVVSVLLAAAPASATISEALSLRELVRQADHVVLATAVDERALRDGRDRIVTDFTVRVEEVMKGDASVGATFEMRRLGGVLGDLGMRIEGEPHLESGKRYVLFLARTTEGHLRPVGMSQGVLPVEQRGRETIVIPGGDGMSLVQRVQGGQLVPAPAALMHETPYSTLRERVMDAQRGTVQP